MWATCICARRDTSGYIRVDWFTPEGLPTWGDGRLTILGTEGYIELRKYIDIAGRPGTDHLFIVNSEGPRHIDCSQVERPSAGSSSPTCATAPKRRCRRSGASTQ